MNPTDYKFSYPARDLGGHIARPRLACASTASRAVDFVVQPARHYLMASSSRPSLVSGCQQLAGLVYSSLVGPFDDAAHLAASLVLTT